MRRIRRRRLSSKVSRKYFSKYAGSHYKNMRAQPMRGGFRI